MTKSIEEQIEDWAKRSLNAYSLQYLTKTEHMDSEIDDALKTEESKKVAMEVIIPILNCLLSLIP